MTRPRADTLFRIGALVGCAIIVLPHVTRRIAIDGLDPRAAVPIALAAIFGAAFWFNTREDSATRPRMPLPATVGLLIVQVFIALTISDFFFLIAAQAPFMFSPHGALAWLGAQLVTFTLLVIVVALAGDDVVIPEMAGTPATIGIPVTIVYLAGWQIFAFSIGYLAASERRSRRELQQRARELVATQQMLADSSRIAERAQISRELHDTLGHNLTVLAVNLELASHLTEGRAADAVTRAQTVGRMLLADVREVVHGIGGERAIDLRGALTTLTEDTHSPVVHLSLPEDLRIDDAAPAHVVFRCVQEAITNAMRHAQARNLWITVTEAEGGLDLRMTDDGRGAAAVTPGHGLTGMQDRLAAVGGRLRMQAEPGKGFTVAAWIPLLKEPS